MAVNSLGSRWTDNVSLATPCTFGPWVELDAGYSRIRGNDGGWLVERSEPKTRTPFGNVLRPLRSQLPTGRFLAIQP